MRQGEIAKLRWEHIDLEARTALLPMTKNGTARKVPLSTRAIEALTWCPPPHRGSVFKLTQSAMQFAFRRVREQCNLGNVRFHDLRHEAASRLFEKGLAAASCSAYFTVAAARFSHSLPRSPDAFCAASTRSCSIRFSSCCAL
jgi:integrase